MTCTNRSCGHEFCWLCLRSWNDPKHDGLKCALQRLDTMSAKRRGLQDSEDNQEVMAAIETQIERNFLAQPSEMRKQPEEYAAEVRKRFGVALNTELPSDKDMLVEAFGGEEEPLLLSLWLLRLYERREHAARAAADAVFCEKSADGEAVSQLRRSLAWIKRRWWLRLQPEDATSPEIEAELDVPAGGELEIRSRLRVARLRAEHAVHCFEEREAVQARSKAQAGIASSFLTRFGKGVDEHAHSEHVTKDLHLDLFALLEAPDQSFIPVTSSSATVGPYAVAVAGAQKALDLAAAASRAWRIGRLLERVGFLPPLRGFEAERASSSAGKWLQELEDRSATLRGLLREGHGDTPSLQDEPEWQLKVSQASALLTGARRRVFEFALEYCGGTRRTVQRRA